jgi:hypothetical protein
MVRILVAEAEAARQAEAAALIRDLGHTPFACCIEQFPLAAVDSLDGAA